MLSIVLLLLPLIAASPITAPESDFYVGASVVRRASTRSCTLQAPIAPVQYHAQATSSHVVTLRRPVSQTEDVVSADEYLEFIGLNVDSVRAEMSLFCSKIVDPELIAPFSTPDEVFPIITSGPPSNRIDVVFMGDGYTAAEKSKFIDDIKRLTNEMWSDTTFAAVLPLFNIWAVFRASADSGIGTNGSPKNTAFGLYRDGTELRGIYPSNANAASQACQATGQYACDYPSVIANDPYYGGLGGQFVIGTR